MGLRGIGLEPEYFLTIIGIHAVLVGFGLLFAGFMSLAVPSDADMEATRKQFEAERRKSRLHYWAFCLGQAATARNKGMSNVMNHWFERSQGRKMIYGGIVCIAIAAAIGVHLGVFNS